MATHAIHHPTVVETDALPAHGARLLRYAAPVGRALFALIFLLSAPTHILGRGVEHAAAQGVPMASIAVPVAGIIALVGALSVLLGWNTRLGASLLALFLIPVTLTMHRFWGLDDSQAATMQLVNFMKNLGLLGTTLLLGYFGAGPVSVDAKRHRAPPPA